MSESPAADAAGEGWDGPTVPQLRQLAYALGATVLSFWTWKWEFQSLDGGWIIVGAFGAFAVAVAVDLGIQHLRGRA